MSTTDAAPLWEAKVRSDTRYSSRLSRWARCDGACRDRAHVGMRHRHGWHDLRLRYGCRSLIEELFPNDAAVLLERCGRYWQRCT
jgi:hypothetical protein